MGNYYSYVNQSKAMELTGTVPFSNERKAAQVGFEPTTYYTNYVVDAPPTEPSMQLRWLG